MKRKEYQKYQELAADLGHAGLVALEASGWQNIYHKLVEKKFDELSEAEKKKVGIKETEKKINLIMLGVAVELLLKAVFVKKGYLIFKIEEPVRIKSWEKSWNMNRTIEASKLIDNLQLIMHKRMKKETIKRHQETLREIIGLKNKETHSIGGTYGKGDREYIELIRLIITMAGKII